MNDPVVLTALAVLLLLVVLVAALAVARSRRRRRRLANRFGPEYEHAVATHGRRHGERELEARGRHVDELDLRELSAEERAELRHRWERVQARFVDHPVAAVSEADELIAETMRRRGYPLDEVFDPERREADLSAAHPREVGLYREAAAIAHRSRSNEATTEELRQAMVHYRTLFESLSGREAAAATAERRPERPGEVVVADGPAHGDGRTHPPATRPGEAAGPHDGPSHGDVRTGRPAEPPEAERGEPLIVGEPAAGTPRRPV